MRKPGDRAAAAFAHDHDNPALAGLVLGQPAVDPLDCQVFRPDMAAEPGAVDLGDASLAADAQRFHAGCDCLTQLVRQHERGLILDIQITGEGEHALALHLVAESGDREQIRPERQLVPGEQRAGGDREVTATRLAAPARLVRRTAACVADHTATARADRLAVGLGPAQAQENVFDAAVGHSHDLGAAKRTRGGRKQKMLRHEHP